MYLTSPTTTKNFSITTPTVAFYKPTVNQNGHINWTIQFTKPDTSGNASINLYLNPIDGFNTSTPILSQSYSIFVDPSATPAQQQAAYSAGVEAFMKTHVVQTTQAKTVKLFPQNNDDGDLVVNHSINTVQGGTITAVGITVGQLPNTYTIPLPLPDYSSTGGLSSDVTNALNAAPTQTVNVAPSSQFAPTWTYSSSDGTKLWSETAYSNIGIPWKYTAENVPGQTASTGSDDAQRNFQRTSAIVNARAAVNSKNQQFIEGIKAKKDTIQSNYDAMNNDIQSSNSSLKGQMSIITSTLATLRAIITGIFA